VRVSVGRRDSYYGCPIPGIKYPVLGGLRYRSPASVEGAVQ
jgi:hypothetical protein